MCTMNLQLDVSVVIVNWNTRDILRNCLRSVYQQTQNIRFETIVIDNASIDDSAAMVRDEFPQVVLIANSQNRGFAAANNQGVEIANGRYVLLLNSDTIILDNAIAKTLEFAKSQPDAAIVGCRVLNTDRTLQPTCFMFPSVLNMLLSTTYLYKLFPKNKLFGRERMGWWNRDDVREVEVVTGCFMLVRREAMEQVGIMDEDYFIYGEETDWCWRFKKSGWRILFTPNAEIIHLGGQSSIQVKPQMVLQLRNGILLFMRKNRGYMSYFIARLLVALFFVIRVPFWFIKGLVVNKSRKADMLVAHTYLKGFVRALIGVKALSSTK